MGERDREDNISICWMIDEIGKAARVQVPNGKRKYRRRSSGRGNQRVDNETSKIDKRKSAKVLKKQEVRWSPMR